MREVLICVDKIENKEGRMLYGEQENEKGIEKRAGKYQKVL